MKVLHLCLSNFYIDKAAYQENFLVRQHVADGHDVAVLASMEMLGDDGKLTYVKPSTYRGSDGAQVTRLPYVWWLPGLLGRKLRVHPGVYEFLEAFAPDAILFHGCAGNEIATCARYVKAHPEVLFYADSHEDFNNSARSPVSRWLLHRIFYRQRLQRALPFLQRVLSISVESIEFCHQVYGVPREKIEFFPLGGFPLSESDIAQKREVQRAAQGVGPQNRVFLASGKMAPRKQLKETLETFARLDDPNARLWVAGVLVDPGKATLEALIAVDDRVRFLGWQSPEQLTDLLCGADVYLQPGSQSATMQHALCCGCPVIIDDVPAHQPYRDSGARLVNGDEDLFRALQEAVALPADIGREPALRFAEEHLDYGVLAQRVLRVAEPA